MLLLAFTTVMMSPHRVSGERSNGYYSGSAGSNFDQGPNVFVWWCCMVVLIGGADLIANHRR